jgi:hypothetical protein
MKHEFVPVFGSRYDTCAFCGLYLDEGDHYPYNPEDDIEVDDDFEDNLAYETNEGGF